MKPLSFPDPAQVSVPDTRGLPVLSLRALIELKLASGMTAPHRRQDLADVIRLIQIRGLGVDFAEELSPYVRAKFEELWNAAQRGDPHP